MQLTVCDECARPLSEGAVARGDAEQIGERLICAKCLPRVKAKQPGPTTSEDTGALADYQQAVWHCDSCGIPVNALDLIEGRANRDGKRVTCSRCRPTTNAPVEAAPSTAAAKPEAPTPAPKAAVSRRAPLKPAKLPTTRSPADSPVARELIKGSERESRFPVLPVLILAIVLPIFALSVYMAIRSQERLAEMAAARDNQPANEAYKPVEYDDPEPVTPYNPPANDEADPTPEDPPQPIGPRATEDFVKGLADIEVKLARPVVEKLQSAELATVWEGLIQAGSRRLIATRPHVRRLLADQDEQTRVLACRVCALLQDQEAVGDLRRMASEDPSEMVRTEAHKARTMLSGKASRELSDMTLGELEEHLRDLQREIERRKSERNK